MTTTTTHPSTERAERWARATTLALVLWGLLHVTGGVVLMITAAGDPLGALQSLGSAAPAAHLMADPGPLVGAVIGFHGLNILWAGLAVTILSVGWSWRNYPRGVPTSLSIAAAADIGLIAYLLIPGRMRISEGLWGPLLLVIAVGAAALGHRGSATVGRTQSSDQRPRKGPST